MCYNGVFQLSSEVVYGKSQTGRTAPLKSEFQLWTLLQGGGPFVTSGSQLEILLEIGLPMTTGTHDKYKHQVYKSIQQLLNWFSCTDVASLSLSDVSFSYSTKTWRDFWFGENFFKHVSLSVCFSQHWLEPNKPVVRQMKCKYHLPSFPVCLHLCVCVCVRVFAHSCVYICVWMLRVMPCMQTSVCLPQAPPVWRGQALQKQTTPQGLIHSHKSWQHIYINVKATGHDKTGNLI